MKFITFGKKYDYKRRSLIRKNISQFTRKILEKGHEHLTIMFIPHSEKKIFNFQISHFALAFVLTMLLVIGLGGLYFWSQQTNKENKIGKQIVKINEQKKDINEFENITPRLIDGVSKVTKATHDLIEITGSRRASNTKRGIGGPSPDEKYDFPKEKKVKEIEKLSQLTKELNNIETKITGIKTLLGGYKKVLNHMPSVFPVYGGGIGQSGFGWRVDPFTFKMAKHNGIDIINQVGTPIKATASGKVKYAQEGGGKGLFVEIQHKFGYSTQYLHMSAILVKKGAVVRKGQIIGRLGNTGRSTGPHLHYEVRVNGVPIDPAPFITLDKFSRFSN